MLLVTRYRRHRIVIVIIAAAAISRRLDSRGDSTLAVRLAATHLSRLSRASGGTNDDAVEPAPHVFLRAAGHHMGHHQDTTAG